MRIEHPAPGTRTNSQVGVLNASGCCLVHLRSKGHAAMAAYHSDQSMERHMKLVRSLLYPVLAAGVLAAIPTMTASALDISGAGATFPYPIYAKWADAYKNETGVGLNYQSIGSGGGI
jgi:hypothetical protein